MSSERELLTMKETSTFKCNLPQMITLLCCVCYDEKQTKTLFLLLQNYDTFSKNKLLNLSF